jgi:hypothetical protein
VADLVSTEIKFFVPKNAGEISEDLCCYNLYKDVVLTEAC